MRKEVEEKKKAQTAYEEKRRKLIEENKKKQEDLLRKEHEKKERNKKKRLLEKSWEMTRWLTRYIDENSNRWKKEKEERKETEKERAEAWLKASRFEKIRILKEKQAENLASKNIKAVIKPASFTPDDQYQAEPQARLEDDQPGK